MGRSVASWKRGHAVGRRDGCPEPGWGPGSAQVGFGSFHAAVAGEGLVLRLLVVGPPHPSARFCVALPSGRAEAFRWAPRCIFEWMGRAPRTLVPGNATEAGGTAFGKVTGSAPSSRLRSHCRCESRCRDPCPGNEKGSAEDAVGFLRRSLLAPVPEVSSMDEPDELLRKGCERISDASENRHGVLMPI